MVEMIAPSRRFVVAMSFHTYPLQVFDMSTSLRPKEV